MLAIKNQGAKFFFLFATGILLLAGCGPAGPRALLSGKKLLEKGKYADAVEKLTTATSILITNAQAWNYLGLAYHSLGDGTNAVHAYQQALALDRNLAETRYNLGCLYLEQNRLDAAKNEFTTFVLRRPNSAGALAKLGTAQLRGKELNAAEKSFTDALKINPQSAEAMNGLGIVMLQRNSAYTALQYFNLALQAQTNYSPAVLNLAVYFQQQPNGKSVALQRYRQYLTLEPNSANAASIADIVRQLDRELNPPKPAPPARPPVVAVQPTNAVKNVATKVANNKPPVIAAKLELKTNAVVVVKPDVKPTLPVVAVANPETNPEPVIRTPQISAPKNSEGEVVVSKPPSPAVLDNKPQPTDVVIIEPQSFAATAPQGASNSIPPKAEAGGFLTAINPKTWFQRPQRPPAPITATPQKVLVPKTNAPPKAPAAFARYPYRISNRLKTGDHKQAEAPFAQGLQAQQDGKFRDAVVAFKAAVKSDPGFFQAHYNLGWSAFQAGDLSQSLASYENALSLDANSADARYNFALALKQSNYFPDSANELEKLLAKHPGDARAHLLLGNLCAEQFDKPQVARAHYLRVLELEPKHPRAGDIRFWLAAHP